MVFIHKKAGAIFPIVLLCLITGKKSQDMPKTLPDGTGFGQHYEPFILPNTTELPYFYTWRQVLAYGLIEEQKPLRDPYLCVVKKVLGMTNFAGGIASRVFFNESELHQQQEQVIEWLSQDLGSGSVDCWNQYSWQTTRIAIDIDCCARILDRGEILYLARIFHDTIVAYYGTPVLIFGSICGPRIKKNKLSSAFHMIAHLSDTVANAKQVAFGFQQRVGEDIPDIDIDTGIYKDSGLVNLRFIYSHKSEDCYECGGRVNERRECIVCHHDGRLRSKETYKPAFVFGLNRKMMNKEDFEFHHSNWLKVAKNHSIWPQPNEMRTDKYQVPAGDALVDMKMLVQPREHMVLQHFPKVADLEPKHIIAIEEAIHMYKPHHDSHAPWPHVIVEKAKQAKNGKAIYIRVSGPGCQDCPYVNRKHNSNKIYFVLSRARVNCLTVACYAAGKDNMSKQKNPCFRDRLDPLRKPIEIPLNPTIYNQIFGREMKSNVPEILATVPCNDSMNIMHAIGKIRNNQTTIAPPYKKRIVEVENNYYHDVIDSELDTNSESESE